MFYNWKKNIGDLFFADVVNYFWNRTWIYELLLSSISLRSLECFRLTLDFGFWNTNECPASILTCILSTGKKLSSNRTTIWNKEQGSYCFTTWIEWESNSCLALLFCIIVLFEEIAFLIFLVHLQLVLGTSNHHFSVYDITDINMLLLF